MVLPLSSNGSRASAASPRGAAGDPSAAGPQPQPPRGEEASRAAAARGRVDACFDSHIHLDRVADATAPTPVYDALVPGIDPAVTAALLGTRRVGWHVGASVHPWYVGELRPAADPRAAHVRALVDDARVAAVGETGLDALRHTTDAAQAQATAWFRFHLDVAAAADKPVIVHCVRAHAACAELLRSAPRTRGVVHGFAGSPEEARAYARIGYLVGIGPAVTRLRSTRVRAAAVAVPDGQLLVETDAPFMAPDARDGEARDLLTVVDAVAALRGTDAANIAALTRRNAFRLLTGRDG